MPELLLNNIPLIKGYNIERVVSSTSRAKSLDFHPLVNYVGEIKSLEVFCTWTFKSNLKDLSTYKSILQAVFNRLIRNPFPPDDNPDWKQLRSFSPIIDPSLKIPKDIEKDSMVVATKVGRINGLRLIYILSRMRKNHFRMILTNCAYHEVGNQRIKYGLKESYYSNKSINNNKMNLELNLVKNTGGSSTGIYSNVFTQLARSRVVITDENLATNEILKFMQDNLITLDAALSDKLLITKLQTLSSITISELLGIKLYLAMHGLDILFWEVSDIEINQSEIPEGFYEFNIIDKADTTRFISMCTKLNSDEVSGKRSEVYSKIMDAYGFFDGELFEGSSNPVNLQLTQLKTNEQVLGEPPTSITSWLNSVFEYLEKYLIVITN